MYDTGHDPRKGCNVNYGQNRDFPTWIRDKMSTSLKPNLSKNESLQLTEQDIWTYK